MTGVRAIPWCLLLCLAASCARMGGDHYVPESLPWSAVLLCECPPRNSSNDGEFYRMQRTTAVAGYDNKQRRDWLMRLAFETASHDSAQKILGLYTDGFECGGLDQLTFNTDKFPGLRRVALCSPGVDLSGDGHSDPIFVLTYDDSIAVVAWNPEQRRDTAVWLPKMISDVRIPSSPDYFLEELALWHPHPDSGCYMVFLKSCLVRSLFRLDTIYGIDLRSNTIRFSFPVAPRYYGLDNQHQIDSLLILQSFDSHTPLRYHGFDADHRYLTALRIDGSMAWADTMTPLRKYPTQGSTYTTDAWGQVLVKASHYSENDPERDSTQLQVYDRPTGRRLRERMFPWNILASIVYRDAGGGLRIVGMTSNAHLVAFDSALELRNDVETDLPDFPIDFVDVIPRVPGSIGDGAEAIVARTTRHQLVVFDGATFQPLLSTGTLPGLDGCVFLRREGLPLRLSVTEGDHSQLFTIAPTPWLTRVGAHADRIIAGFIFLCLLPAGLYAARRIRYHRLLFRTLTARSTAQGVVVFKRNGRLRTINGRARMLLDLPDDVAPTTIDGFPPPAPTMFAKYLTSGDEQNAQIILGAGEQRFLSASMSGFRGFGNIAAVVLVLADVTEIVESELRRNMLALSLAIAHDANNPLAAIRSKFDGMITRIRREGLATGAWIDDGERVVTESIDEARDVIRKLMYITNITESSFTTADLRTVIDDWMERAGRRYRRSGVHLVNDIPGNLPPLLLEPKHIGLLVQCACDNSFEAMREDQTDGVITFGAVHTGSDVHFTISDNGSGIDAETLDALERPYFTTKSTGSGLGLRIIRKVASRHGGRIVVTSLVGRGTRLTVVLPIVMNNDTIDNDTGNDHRPHLETHT